MHVAKGTQLAWRTLTSDCISLITVCFAAIKIGFKMFTKQDSWSQKPAHR